VLRATSSRLLIDPSHYEGEGDDRVATPMPLGKMGRRLQEIGRAIHPDGEFTVDFGCGPASGICWAYSKL